MNHYLQLFTNNNFKIALLCYLCYFNQFKCISKSAAFWNYLSSCKYLYINIIWKSIEMPYKRLSNHRGWDIKIILWSINSSNTPAWMNKTYSSSIIWWSILQNCTLIFFCLKPTRIIHIIDHFFLRVWLPLFWIKCFKLRDKTNSRSFKLFVIRSRISPPFFFVLQEWRKKYTRII